MRIGSRSVVLKGVGQPIHVSGAIIVGFVPKVYTGKLYPLNTLISTHSRRSAYPYNFVVGTSRKFTNKFTIIYEGISIKVYNMAILRDFYKVLESSFANFVASGNFLC